ncbi:MAG: hypothetical protein L3K18_02680 [Thermoplasmata archaeon]|nr:hypothetical protein [Thermoplasmata archaeon]MCI4356037.1 hypothetical protein [Thermoplasmata archaeon]
MRSWDDRAEEGPLDDRVVEFLMERPGRVAFNGLKRALDAHPESLVRSLRRLERHGVVRRESDGYQLIDRPDLPGPAARPRTRPFASVELAPGASRTELFGRLAGRWFGPLRWLGLYEPSDGPWLVWSVQGTRGQVRLGIRRGRLTVTTDPSGESDGDAKVEDAARSLLRHALDALGPSHPEEPGLLSFTRAPEPRGFAS